MKLLLDQNLSHRLLSSLEEHFTGSQHVRTLGLARASDSEVWEYARANEFTIVTQDADFYDRSILHGFPPKVIWIHAGNVSTGSLRSLMMSNQKAILEFGSDVERGCLEMSSS